MVAAPVGLLDLGYELGGGAVHHRRLVHDLERRLGVPSRSAGEAVGELALARRQHATPKRWPSCSRLHILVAVDRDQHQGRLQRDRHEGVCGHAVDLIAGRRGDHGDPGSEHAERLAAARGRGPSPSISSSSLPSGPIAVSPIPRDRSRPRPGLGEAEVELRRLRLLVGHQHIHLYRRSDRPRVNRAPVAQLIERRLSGGGPGRNPAGRAHRAQAATGGWPVLARVSRAGARARVPDTSRRGPALTQLHLGPGRGPRGSWRNPNWRSISPFGLPSPRMSGSISVPESSQISSTTSRTALGCPQPALKASPAPRPCQRSAMAT